MISMTTATEPSGDARRDGEHRQIEIRVGHALALVSPASAGMLRPLLRCTQIEYQPGGPGGCELVERESSFFAPRGDGTVIIRPGSVLHVAAALRQQGYRVRVVDLRCFDAPAFAQKDVLLDTLETADRRVLQAIMQNPMGRLCIPPGGLRNRAIGLSCRYYHQAKILIPSATIRQAAEMAGAGGVPRRQCQRGPQPRVAVAGPRRLLHVFELRDGRALRLQIVIFPAGEQLLARKAISGWQDFNNPDYYPRPHRVYAFMAPCQRNSQATELRLEVLTGPVIYKAPTILGQQAGVRVLFAAAPWSAPGNRVSPLDDMRRFYWHNTARNDTLAALARACRRRPGSAVATRRAPRRPAVPRGEPRLRAVAILSESTEHGRELQLRLPGWPLLHAEAGGNSQSAGQHPAQCAWGLPDQAIVTLVRAAQLQQFDTDVLIMATGRGKPSIPAGFPPMVASARQRQVLIVDINDDFDRIARHDARQRMEHYRSRGFEVDVPSRWRVGQRGRPR